LPGENTKYKKGKNTKYYQGVKYLFSETAHEIFNPSSFCSLSVSREKKVSQ